MKRVLTVVVAIMLVGFIGCGSGKEEAESMQEEAPKAPDVNLHVAALQGNIVAVQQHIAAGSNLNEKDQYGSTPLIVAITFDKTDVARALIDAGADIQSANNDGSSPLHVAAFMCRTEVVKALLEHGADKSATNNSGHTALQSVSAPFEAVRPVYDAIGEGLKPLGLTLDYERIEKTRPVIAEMLM